MKLLAAVLTLATQRANTSNASDNAFLKALVEIVCEHATPNIVKRWADEWASKRKEPPDAA